MKITVDQALDLADSFRQAARALGDYVYENWRSLSAGERERLRSMHLSLVNAASDLTTHAVGVAIDEAQASVQQLNSAAEDAREAVKEITAVKSAIALATALIALAAAVPTGNMLVIVPALINLKGAVEVVSAGAEN